MPKINNNKAPIIMSRRGFFAEIQHQNRLAAKREARALREGEAEIRRAERARRSLENSRLRLLKAEAADRKRLDKEERAAYIMAMEAEADSLNADLKDHYSDIETLLSATLNVDDYVDLNALRASPQHPQFKRPDLENPCPVPSEPPVPAEPVLQLPDPPKGIFSFLGKKKHAAAVEEALQLHTSVVETWKSVCLESRARHESAIEEHAKAEADRVVRLQAARSLYEEECRSREREVEESNRKLDDLIARLGYGTQDAIEEYISIVLANSIYPEHFPVTHEFSFDAATAELRLQVIIPPPSSLPEIKHYKYSKSSDEVTATTQSQKESRERYAGAAHQVALRSFHEVFEADRRGLIQTIALQVGADTNDPATGQRSFIPFIIAAIERSVFLGFDLSAIVPAMTLERIGASVSKNPHALVAAPRAGVRKS